MLVRWQMNTLKKDFLPRLGSAITHIVSSKDASLTAVCHKDNGLYRSAFTQFSVHPLKFCSFSPETLAVQKWSLVMSTKGSVPRMYCIEKQKETTVIASLKGTDASSTYQNCGYPLGHLSKHF